MAAELIYVNLGFGSTEQNRADSFSQEMAELPVDMRVSDFLTGCSSDICLTIYINHPSALKIYPA